MKKQCGECVASLGLIIIALGVYVLALFKDGGYAGDSWWIYCTLRFVASIASGALLCVGLKKQKIWFLGSPVLYFGLMIASGLSFIAALQMLVIALFPVVMLLICKKTQNLPHWGVAIYTVSGIILIYLIETVLSPWKYYNNEIAGTVYMAIVVVVMWHMKNREAGKASHWQIMSIIVFGALIICNERLLKILTSFKVPVDTYTGLTGVNWLEYRLEIIKNAWMGDFSLMELHMEVSKACPMMWINYVLGKGFAMIYILAVVGAWVLLAKIAKRESNVLTVALLTKGILGFLSEILMITGTTMGAVGVRNSADIILIMLIAMILRGDKNGNLAGI